MSNNKDMMKQLVQTYCANDNDDYDSSKAPQPVAAQSTIRLDSFFIMEGSKPVLDKEKMSNVKQIWLIQFLNRLAKSITSEKRLFDLGKERFFPRMLQMSFNCGEIYPLVCYYVKTVATKETKECPICWVINNKSWKENGSFLKDWYVSLDTDQSFRPAINFNYKTVTLAYRRLTFWSKRHNECKMAELPNVPIFSHYNPWFQHRHVFIFLNLIETVQIELNGSKWNYQVNAYDFECISMFCKSWARWRVSDHSYVPDDLNDVPHPYEEFKSHCSPIGIKFLGFRYYLLNHHKLPDPDQTTLEYYFIRPPLMDDEYC